MSTILYKRWLFPLTFWGIISLLLFSMSIQGNGIAFAFRLLLLYLLPLSIPVHLHEFLFERFFLKKKYFIYAPLAVLMVVGFGVGMDFIEEFIEPGNGNSPIGSIVMAIIVYTGTKYFVTGAQQRMRLNEMEAKQAQAELDLLKMQVNPHFLFNALNSIYALTLKNSPKASEAVMLLSDLMRYILDTGKKQTVPLNEEVAFIESYIAFEQLRLGNNFTMNYSATGEMADLYIAPMLLIAFVENIFKHGVSANADNNLFEIKIAVSGGELHFCCANNMVARNNELERKSHKTGIANVKRRLELFYANKHQLLIEQKNNAFRVDLVIHLNGA